MNSKRTRNSIARPFGVVSILFTNSRMDTVFRRRWHADFCRRERDASFSLSVHRKLQQCRPPFGVGGLFPQNRMVRAIPLHSTAYSKQRHPFRAVRLPVVSPQCRGTHCASAFLLTQKVQLDNRTLHTVSIRTRNAYLRGGTKSTAVLYQKNCRTIRFLKIAVYRRRLGTTWVCGEPPVNRFFEKTTMLCRVLFKPYTASSNRSTAFKINMGIAPSL